MGSSSEAKGIDSSVGGLVWVRRRNGSWWPGKILGLDELSESCLVSPRSGTPVKLLGRADASIDWYNLEKSKRVKAFRCGEYDECIEKAKASAANSCKKAVKYARREDAILHALELESSLLGKDLLDFSYRTEKNASDGEPCVLASESLPVSDSCEEEEEEEGEGEGEGEGEEEEEEEATMSDDVSNSEDACAKKSNYEETCPKKSNSEVSSDSAPEMSHSDIPLEETNPASFSKVLSEQNRRRTPDDSEDDGTVKRMRGLEDLGMGSLANGKVHAGEQPEIVQQEDASHCDVNAGNCVTNGNPPKIIHMYSSSLRRKRSPVPTVQKFLKRNNRRRPLTKVLESTAMVSVPVTCDQLPNTCSSSAWGASDSKLPDLDTAKTRGNSLATANSSDGNGTAVSCDNEATLSASDVSRINPKAKENEVSSISELPKNNSSDKLFDVPFVGEEKNAAGFSPTNPSSSGRATVDALGKQSSRNTSAAFLENEATKEPETTSTATRNDTSTATRNDNTNQKIERGTSRWQIKGKRKSRHLSNYRKLDSINSLDVDDASDACLAGKVDCNSFGRFPFSNDCSLLAKSKSFAESQVDGLCEWGKPISYRKPHAIELKTEVKQLLDDSLVPQKLLPYRQSHFTVHSRYQMPEYYGINYGANSLLYDVELEVKASYRPQHVPLVSLMSKLNGKAIVGHPLTVEIVEDGHCDSLLSKPDTELEGDDNHYAVKHSASTRTRAKQSTSQPCSSPRKSPRMKKSGHLCKKIRKLSSLTGNRHQNQPKQLVQKSNDHVITCIPLKVVFSRINEALSGLARPSHHALSNP